MKSTLAVGIALSLFAMGCNGSWGEKDSRSGLPEKQASQGSTAPRETEPARPVEAICTDEGCLATDQSIEYWLSEAVRISATVVAVRLNEVNESIIHHEAGPGVSYMFRVLDIDLVTENIYLPQRPDPSSPASTTIRVVAPGCYEPSYDQSFGEDRTYVPQCFDALHGQKFSSGSRKVLFLQGGISGEPYIAWDIVDDTVMDPSDSTRRLSLEEFATLAAATQSRLNP